MSRLTLPVGPRDHLQGNVHAKLFLVEYGDYECPYCAIAYPIVKVVQQHFGNRLCFAFRNFPLTEAHPHAEAAAETAEAAAVENRFWDMHDMLYESHDALEIKDLVGYVQTLELDVRRVSSELEQRVYLPRVREDFASGVRSGVNGTPTFFINGVRFDGQWDAPGLIAALSHH